VEHDERWGMGGEEQVLETVQLLEMRGDGMGYYECVEEWRFVERVEEGEEGGMEEGVGLRGVAAEGDCVLEETK